MKYYKWIELATGKRLRTTPICVGRRGGRKVYCLAFTDWTEADYYIDFDRKEIEAV